MSTVSQGTRRAPITASGIIRTTGTNHTWSAPMTDMQRENAEAPFAAEPEHGRFRSALVCMLLVGLAAYVLVSL